MGASSEKQEDLRSKKTMLQELRAFVLASPQHSFLTDIHIAKWNDATVMDLLGDDLGACVLEHVAEYQDKIASAANISNSTGSTTSQSPANRLKLSSRSCQVEAQASLLSKWKAPSLWAVAHHGDQGFPIGMSLCGALDIAISICGD